MIIFFILCFGTGLVLAFWYNNYYLTKQRIRITQSKKITEYLTILDQAELLEYQEKDSKEKKLEALYFLKKNNLWPQEKIERLRGEILNEKV